MKRLSDAAVRRWAWVSFVGFLASGLLSLVVGLMDPTNVADWGSSGNAGDIVFTLVILLFPLVGLMITHRQPRNRIGWLLLVIGLTWGLSGLIDAYSEVALLVRPGSLPGGLAAQVVASAFWLPPIGEMGIFLILLFPDGHLPSRRWRPLAWTGIAVIVVGTLMMSLSPGVVNDVRVPGHPNPIGIEALRGLLYPILGVVLLLLPLCVLASAWALITRFRRSTGVERLQLKWLSTAGAFVAVAYGLAMGSGVPSALGLGLDPTIITAIDNIALISFGLIPIAIGVAVSRHGLYGIDAIISRALVFGALAVFITGVYVAIVVGIGALVGQQHPSVLLSVFATAIVALAFQPVRQRVHRVANRMVYGERATPYEVLSDFASRMAAQYTTGELLPQLAQTLSKCLGGARVEVWLQSADGLAREVCWPPEAAVPASAPEGDRVVPVGHYGELLGMITVLKPGGEHVTPTEDKMLDAVASQAGLMLRNVRLIDDLRTSRERLVTTQDDERRRLERNLHDGAQQSLVSVALLLRMATGHVADDRVRASLTEASAQLQQAIDELRELARGIHPAILTERGLGPALTSLAERSPVPVEVEQTVRERLPATVEGTIYFVAAEALTNVAKYARATSVTLRLDREDGEVVLVVADDGVGGADPVGGTGLRGLSDRVAAVDGAFDVQSRHGEGTRIECRVPVVVARVPVLETVS
jgi:signal transduction histidine kinase